MSETTTRNKRRSPEERIAELEAKIQYHEQCVAALLQKKERILSPKTRTRKLSMKKVSDRIKELGMTPEQVMELIEKAKK